MFILLIHKDYKDNFVSRYSTSAPYQFITCKQGIITMFHFQVLFVYGVGLKVVL